MSIATIDSTAYRTANAQQEKASNNKIKQYPGNQNRN